MSCTCNNLGTCLDCRLSVALKNAQIDRTHTFGMSIVPTLRENLCIQCRDRLSCKEPCRRFVDNLKELAILAFAGMAAEN